MYYIIYPSGDRSKLGIVELEEDSLDILDYAMASRTPFYTFELAQDHAKALAVKHSKTYVPPRGTPDYLD